MRVFAMFGAKPGPAGRSDVCRTPTRNTTPSATSYNADGTSGGSERVHQGRMQVGSRIVAVGHPLRYVASHVFCPAPTPPAGVAADGPRATQVQPIHVGDA